MGLRKLLVGFLLGGVIAAAPAADNPYQGIVARNVFGLKDPPPPPNPEDNKPPPPKILLQGIATVLGVKQVLFDVEKPPTPPQAGARTSMLLAVGNAEDDIEVLEIDEATRTVKFRNHGVEETKTLDKDSKKPAVAALPVPNFVTAPAGAPVVARPTIPQPGLQSIPTRTPKSAAASELPPLPPTPGAP